MNSIIKHGGLLATAGGVGFLVGLFSARKSGSDLRDDLMIKASDLFQNNSWLSGVIEFFSSKFNKTSSAFATGSDNPFDEQEGDSLFEKYSKDANADRSGPQVPQAPKKLFNPEMQADWREAFGQPRQVHGQIPRPRRLFND